MGCLGEVVLVPAVVLWVGWPLAVPAALQQFIWMLLAAPFSIVLLALATRQLRYNWSSSPQYKADRAAQQDRLQEKAEAAHSAFLAKRNAAAALPTELLV